MRGPGSRGRELGAGARGREPGGGCQGRQPGAGGRRPGPGAGGRGPGPKLKVLKTRSSQIEVSKLGVPKSKFQIGVRGSRAGDWGPGTGGRGPGAVGRAKTHFSYSIILFSANN